MYAVIATGGKQYKVSEGQRLDVERLGSQEGDVSFEPVLVVDGEQVWAVPRELEGAQVMAKVVGEAKGPKIRGFTYKPKTNNRKRWGHRQSYATIEITGIQGPERPDRAGIQGPERPDRAGIQAPSQGG